MRRGVDVEKRREWERRFGQFRASGSTVARFCASQGLSVNTFYYWSKRIDKPAAPAHSSATHPSAARSVTAKARVDGTGVSRADASAAANGSRVHFRLGSGIEVSVPADCLAVIRCLAESFGPARTERGGAFQQVVLGSR
ncbi:MAG TPA: hypothetical protein VGG64_03700 [Pirellulales bacterium]|jgi:hypothetical protein